MNLHPPELAGFRGKLFPLVAFFLFCLMATVAPVCIGGSTPPAATNYPAIYLVTAPQPEVTNGLGYWMWDSVTSNKQTVRLWHGFVVSKTNPVVRAELRIAADNAFKVWLDGQEVGSGSDWRTLSIYHLEGRLNGGAHAVAVEGFNDNDQAGIILGFRLETANGQLIQIRSDTTWRIVPNSAHGWETALRPDEDWPKSSRARNFGRLPWWSIPTSVLHIRGALPQPVPIWQSREFQFCLFAGCVIFVVICLYLLIQLMSQSKAHHLVQAERDRIARDIHDDLGSKLTQLLLTGEMAQIKSGSTPEEPLSQICDGARNVLATIDEVVWIINSQHDNLDDFAIYVCKFAQHFLEPTAIRCRFEAAAELPPKPLSQLMRRNLFLAIKEALNNAVKHSQATELTVRIELIGFRLHVIAADNGRGFDAARVDRQRHGLSNMEQRMAEIGGDCEVASRPGEGCQVKFEVPLKQQSFFKRLFRSQSRNGFAGLNTLNEKDITVSAGEAE